MTPVVLDPLPSPAPPLADRDARLGPLRFPTVEGQLKETLGDALETVGAVAIPGERRPRPFTLQLPIHGMSSDGSDYLMEGERLRAQVRALIENPRARLQGLWFSFAPDPVIDGWLLVGGADLSYTEPGTTFADYLLELTDCYRVGDRNTHRPARRLEARDRRLSTTPRDYLGRLRSTDFASLSPAPFARHYLPVGVSDVVGSAGTVFGTVLANTIDGTIAYVDARPDKDTVSYEQSPDDDGKGDVLVLDRRGNTAPPYTPADDATPERSYGWIALYGTTQEVTDGDVPVLQNGICRVRYVPDHQAFTFDAYIAGDGYVEQGRATVWRNYPPGGAETQYATFVDARLLEWTPERAVVRVTLSLDALNRCEVYLTLQRGWPGPRIEAYGAWSSAGKPGVAVRVSPITAGMNEMGTAFSSLVFVDGNDYGPLGAGEPWVYLAPGGQNAIHVAVLQGGVHLVGRTGSAAYGAPRNSASFVAPYGSAAAGYVSVTLGSGPYASRVADARTLGQLNLYDCRQIPGIVSR